MINIIVDILFRWEKLRKALLTEAHFYNIIEETLNDPEAMQTAAMYWNEGDGWRYWEYDEDKKRYFFDDIPQDKLDMVGNYDSERKESI